MSGIAEVLCNLGYTVQGSDASESANVNRLRDKGITITVGHKAENVRRRRCLVVVDPRSSATIPNDGGARATHPGGCAAPKCWPS